jgi:hypothetical protein
MFCIRLFAFISCAPSNIADSCQLSAISGQFSESFSHGVAPRRVWFRCEP